MSPIADRPQSPAPSVTVRPFEMSDFDKTCDLMPPEWRFASCTQEERDAQARMDTSGVLAAANLRLVAEPAACSHRGDETQLAGYLFARLEGLPAPTDADYWNAIWEQAGATLHAAGERGARVAAYEEQLGERGDLLVEAAGDNRGQDNELELFVANPAMRGQGAGSALMAAFEDALHRLGATSYWLQTDSTCTWQWYERHGYQRVADVELDERFPMPDAPEARSGAQGAPHVFMYRKDL